MGQGLPKDARETTRGIAFFDFDRFAGWASGRPDADVARLLQAFYEAAGTLLGPAGVRLVKFMGDAGLVVFPPERTREAVAAFEALRARAVALGRERGFETALTVKVHVGPVVEGTFGPEALARYDVLGRAVNEAAMLPGRGLVLSEDARSLLG